MECTLSASSLKTLHRTLATLSRLSPNLELLFLPNLFRISASSPSVRAFGKISFDPEVFFERYKVFGRVVKERFGDRDDEKARRGDKKRKGKGKKKKDGDKGKEKEENKNQKKKRRMNGMDVKGKQKAIDQDAQTDEDEEMHDASENDGGEDDGEFEEYERPRIVNIDVNAKAILSILPSSSSLSSSASTSIECAHLSVREASLSSYSVSPRQKKKRNQSGKKGRKEGGGSSVVDKRKKGVRGWGEDSMDDEGEDEEEEGGDEEEEAEGDGEDEVNPGECRLVTKLEYRSGVIKTRKLIYQPCKSLEPESSQSACTSNWTVGGGVLKSWTDTFYTPSSSASSTTASTDEISILFSQNSCRIKSFNDQQQQHQDQMMVLGLEGKRGRGNRNRNRATMSTELAVDVNDFDEYVISGEPILTFGLKDFKTIISLSLLSNAHPIPLVASFTTGGSPLHLSLSPSGSDDHTTNFQAEFVLSTSAGDPAGIMGGWGVKPEKNEKEKGKEGEKGKGKDKDKGKGKDKDKGKGKEAMTAIGRMRSVDQGGGGHGQPSSSSTSESRDRSRATTVTHSASAPAIGHSKTQPQQQQQQVNKAGKGKFVSQSTTPLAFREAREDQQQQPPLFFPPTQQQQVRLETVQEGGEVVQGKKRREEEEDMIMRELTQGLDFGDDFGMGIDMDLGGDDGNENGKRDEEEDFDLPPPVRVTPTEQQQQQYQKSHQQPSRIEPKPPPSRQGDKPSAQAFPPFDLNRTPKQRQRQQNNHPIASGSNKNPATDPNSIDANHVEEDEEIPSSSEEEGGGISYPDLAADHLPDGTSPGSGIRRRRHHHRPKTAMRGNRGVLVPQTSSGSAGVAGGELDGYQGKQKSRSSGGGGHGGRRRILFEEDEDGFGFNDQSNDGVVREDELNDDDEQLQGNQVGRDDEDDEMKTDETELVMTQPEEVEDKRPKGHSGSRKWNLFD